MAKYKLPDETELARVKELHRTFMTYLPKYADVRKEKYFVTQQVSLWEQYRKSVQQLVAQKQRRLNVMLPNHPNLPKETLELQKMQNVMLAIAEEELGRLYSFVSTYNKIEKRKLDYFKAKQSADLGSKGVRTKLDDIHTREKPVEAKQKETAAAACPSQDSAKPGFRSRIFFHRRHLRGNPQSIFTDRSVPGGCH